MDLHRSLGNFPRIRLPLGLMRAFPLILGMLLALSLMYTETNAATPVYVGVKSCSICHKTEKQGNQLAIWKKSDHSKAYRTLAGEEARKQAAMVGVSGNPQEAEACLLCHTTGFGEPKTSFKKKFKVEDGVQCEACHGAGSLYKKKKTMKKISKERGPDKRNESPTAKATFLTFPDENTCKTCHTRERKFNGSVFKNPSFKDFVFKERFEKIAHPVPR